MTLHAVHGDTAALWSEPQRVTKLLSRYPQMSRKAIREVQRFIRSGRYLDIMLVASNDKLRSKLDAFMKDHGSRSGRTRPDLGAIAGAIVLMLFIFWAVWTAAQP